MSEDRPRRILSTVALWLGGACGLVLLYVLSIGPVVWLDDNDMLPFGDSTFWEVVYEPLGWLEGTALDEPMQRYIDWWTDNRPAAHMDRSGPKAPSETRA